MDDPWAAGPSWTTDTRAARAADLPLSSSSVFADPQDPWAPSTAKQPTPLYSPATLPDTAPPTWNTPGDVWDQPGSPTKGESAWVAPASSSLPVTALQSTPPPSSPLSNGHPAVPSPPSPFAPVASPSQSPRTSVEKVDLAISLPALAPSVVGDDPWSRAPESSRDKVTETSRGGMLNRPEAKVDDRRGDSGDEGWGATTVGPPAPAHQPLEDDWELEQRRLQLKEARLPRAKIESIKQDWRTFGQAFAPGSLDEKEVTLPKLEETMLSLAVIPSSLNIFPHIPPVTHERFSYALTRPNPVPSTSFIHICNSRKPTRRTILKQESPWLLRSKLSEPEAHEAVMQTGVPSSKWSFWKRPSPERQLTTSGGSVLEIKTPVDPEANTRPPSALSKVSRPASPAIQSRPQTEKLDAVVARPLDSSQPPSSAVSRFFGRLGRKPSVVSMDDEDDDDDDKADLDLPKGDLDLLSDVPVTRRLSPVPSIGQGISFQPTSSETTIQSNNLRFTSTVPPSPHLSSRTSMQQTDLLGDWDAFESSQLGRERGSTSTSSDPLWSVIEPQGSVLNSKAATLPRRQPEARRSMGENVDEFVDFGTPKGGLQFDDFDFGDFESSTTTKPVAASHAPTLALLGEASTRRGKRWPAPVSPGLPLLAPPPKQAAVPMLSPPPGSRPSNVDLLGETEDPPERPSAVSTSNVGFRKTPNTLPGPGTGKSGLSTTDFSFFDNL